MIKDNLSLAYLLLELRPLIEGSYVNKVSEISPGVIKIKLHTKQGSKDLILSQNNFFISSYSIPARHSKGNFATALKKELYNKRIVGIEQHGLDRAFTIKFLEHSLIVEFLGEGNKILVDSSGKIISCQKNEEWSERTIKKGEKYLYPKQSTSSPLDISQEGISKIFSSSQKDSIRALISSVAVSPLAAEEVFYLQGVEKSKHAKYLAQPDVQKIVRGVKEIYTIDEKKLKPVSYKDFLYPFVLLHLKEEPTKIPSLNFALSETLSSKAANIVQEKEKLHSAGKVSGLEFMKKQQEEAAKKFTSQIEQNHQKAEAIYSNYNEVEQIIKAVRSATQKGISEKEILSTFKTAAQKGNKSAARVLKIDLAKKKIELEL